MNLTKLTIPLGVVLTALLTAGAAVAGHPKSGEGPHYGRHSAEAHLARLADSLDLNDEQSAELLIVLQASEEERRALHRQIMQQIRPEVCAQREATHAEILSILTPQQAEEFQAMIAEHEQRTFGRGRRGGWSDVNCEAG